MKKVVFVISHVGSGSYEMIYLLNKNDRVNIQTSHTLYEHPTNLQTLFETPHKCRSFAAIYGDHLLYNMNFQCKRLHEWCDFVYVIRNGRDAMREIALGEPYTPQTAYRYYCFRIRRIYEMAKRTPRAILITRNDLLTGKAFPSLERFLKLRTPIEITPEEQERFHPHPFNEPPSMLLDKAQDCFEYYYYKLKQIPHLLVCE